MGRRREADSFESVSGSQISSTEVGAGSGWKWEEEVNYLSGGHGGMEVGSADWK